MASEYFEHYEFVDASRRERHTGEICTERDRACRIREDPRACLPTCFFCDMPSEAEESSTVV
jgi:hypothetical protein